MKPNAAFLAFLLFFPLIFSGQSRWMRTYHDNWDTPNLDIDLSYDGGYLISGRQIPNYPKYNWLIKTDINGEILWEKLIGDGMNSIVLINMDQGESGEIFLAGVTGAYGDYSDPIIIKLDECGDKEWCRVLPSYDHLDYAYDVCAIGDGGCAVSLRYLSDDYGENRICLMRLDAEGNELWLKCYNSPDTNVDNQEHYNLIMAPDHGFLLTGDTYYRDVNPPNYFWLKPYFIKTDPDGNFQWELVVNKDLSHNGGEAFSTVVSPDGLFYYAAGAHFYSEGVYGDTPALIKIDLSGNLVGFYDLYSPDYYGKMFDLGFLSDSTIAVSAIWGDETHEPMAAIIDTQGNIKDYSYLMSNEYMSYVRTTSDEKSIFYTMTLKENNNYGVFLFKLNRQLEGDTLYLQPFRYDSLCDYPIIYDTVDIDDCGLIVDIEEFPSSPAPVQMVKAYPNPCNDFIEFSFLGEKPMQVDLFSSYGQLFFTLDIIEDENDLWMNTASLPPGLIFAVFRYPDGRIETVKFIKI